MSKCEICNVECTGRTCSGACRARLSRRTRTDEAHAEEQAHAHAAKPEGVTSDMPVIPADVNLGKHEDAPRSTNSAPAISEHQAVLDHYYANPDMYISRQEPERLNWGEYMTIAELASAKLKANRVPIPGDHDYVGVAQDMQGSATSHDQEARVT